MVEPLPLRLYAGWLAARHAVAFHKGHHRVSRRWARKAVAS